MKRKTKCLSNKILHLQNLIKRDSSSYYDEFYQYYQLYHSFIQVFKMKPQEYNKDLADIIMFLAQVCSYYTDDLKAFPQELMCLLKEFHMVLDPSMRMAFCRALILIRNRGLLAPSDLISLFFEMLKCKDKILRKQLQVHIITDVKNINSKHKHAKVNTVVQNFMFKVLCGHNATAVKMSLDIIIELYRRNIWKDTKTVNAIATACFSKVNKVLVAAHQFFLGVDKGDDSDNSNSEDDEPTVKDVVAANKVNKKSRSRNKVLEKAKKVLKKGKKRNKKENFDFSAIHLLNDPQGMAEKLLANLQKMNERYEVKLVVMNLISRLIGIHGLILLNYYPLLQRYLQPHQRDVTKILMFAAQSAHENVPPDVVEPVVRTIAQNFITDRNSPEVITVGINAIRELCLRCPLSINQDLLDDLVQYKKYKNKNVVMAARSLMQLFRQLNPDMLKKKYRSRPTEASVEQYFINFGELNAKSYIPGTEVLPVEINDSEKDCGKSFESNDDDDDEDLEEEELSSDDSIEKDDEINDVEQSETLDECNKSANEISTARKKETEKVEKAIAVSQSRILSQEEFHKVKVAQILKETQHLKGKKRKIDIDNLEDSHSDRGELVSLQDIEKLHKKPKSDKETRLATILESREGREKYGTRQKKSPFSSLTQKQKNKKKAFMMIKHKVKAKSKRSFHDKQITLRNALLKRKKNR